MHQDLLAEFMMMNEVEVLEKFNTLPNSVFVLKHNAYRYSSIYVPGTRKDRVLLVAHADTFSDSCGDIAYNQGEFLAAQTFNGRKKFLPDKVYTSKNIPDSAGKKEDKWLPIGADDRAGCAILWLLRDLGHSILITNSEEIGCVGAISTSSHRQIVEEINNTHSYAIEFDRRGHRNCVFYDVGTPEFEEWFSNQWRYRVGQGSVSDICHICHDMCGVNVSVGYYGEHSKMERLIYWQWEHTLETARHQLTKEQRSWRLFK